MESYNRANPLFTLTIGEFIDLNRKITEEVVKEYFSKIENTAVEKEELLDIKQAAEFLKLSVPTLYGLNTRRDIPHFKVGKKLYYKRTDLINWISSGRRMTKLEIRQEADSVLSKDFRKRNR